VAHEEQAARAAAAVAPQDPRPVSGLAQAGDARVDLDHLREIAPASAANFIEMDQVNVRGPA
jgi:hypothetical protein